MWLYEAVVQETRVIKRRVRVEAGSRAEARESALEPSKWLSCSDLEQDIEDGELESMTVLTLAHLWQRGEPPTVPD